MSKHHPLHVYHALTTAMNGQQVCWLAPSYQEALKVWRHFLRVTTSLLEAGIVEQVSKPSLSIGFLGHGKIVVYYLSGMDDLRGQQFDHIIVGSKTLDENSTDAHVVCKYLARQNGKVERYN